MQSYKKNSSNFEKDLKTRGKLNDMNLDDLWKLVCDDSLFKFYGKSTLNKFYKIYTKQKIIHPGISRKKYLLHPLRMALFFKKYFPY